MVCTGHTFSTCCEGGLRRSLAISPPASGQKVLSWVTCDPCPVEVVSGAEGGTASYLTPCLHWGCLSCNDGPIKSEPG